VSVDAAHAWWDRVEIDLKLRRGQSGARLLERAGRVGDSPYRLRLAVERIVSILHEWALSGEPPGWATKLLREAKRYREVLREVPPIGDEVESG
jgi:hypothetical protein